MPRFVVLDAEGLAILYNAQKRLQDDTRDHIAGMTHANLLVDKQTASNCVMLVCKNFPLANPRSLA